MDRLFNSLNPQQVAALVHSVNQPTFAGNMPKSFARGKGKKKVAIATQTNAKATRPLNSWIAFRSMSPKHSSIENPF